MHEPIKQRLEEYLRGAGDRENLRELKMHLEACEKCRETVQQMEEQARLLRTLRAPEDLEPRVGFYARVMDQIEARRRLSIWSVFMEPVFGQRIVFASLVILILLGSFLISSERAAPVAPSSPEVIIAVEPHPREIGSDPQRDRETILVTLATYEGGRQ